MSGKGNVNNLPWPSIHILTHQFMLHTSGTQYAGEMKKGVFTVMNYWLPKQVGEHG